MVSGKSPGLTRPDVNQWRGIRLVSAYRVFLAVALTAASIAEFGRTIFTPTDSYLFALVAWSYLGISLLFEATLELQVLSFRTQAHLHTATDIIVLSLLAFASGGPEGPLSLLLIIAVGMAAALLGGRSAIGYAAAGTLLTLGGALATAFFTNQPPPYTSTGFLGLALFMMATLVNSLEQRTRRWQLHSLAREREAQYRSALALRIIEQSDDGLIICQPDGGIEYINQAALTLLHPNKATAARYQGLPLNYQHPQLADTLAQWLKQPEKTRFDFDHPHRFRASFHYLKTELGPRALIMLLDLSAEDERVQRDKLASLGRLIASIAHELRNPLSSIRQASDLLPGAQTAEERNQLTDIIKRQTQRINRLVEDVLNAARTPRVQPVAIELQHWMAHFIAQQKALFDKQNPQIECHLGPDAPTIWFDRVHLEQILSNLVANAINHHPTGTDEPPFVRILLNRTQPGRFVLAVCDQNPIIPLDTRTAMFEPFFTTHQAGTGLGLFIARELAQANESDLAWHPADEQDNRGNCFTLDLKAAPDWHDNNDT